MRDMHLMHEVAKQMIEERRREAERHRLAARHSRTGRLSRFLNAIARREAQ